MSGTKPLINDSERIDENDKENSTNSFQTFMNLLKSNVGLGVLTMPYAVSHAGSIVGPAMILVIGCIVLYNMCLICESNLILIQKHKKKKLGLAGTIKYSLKPYFGGKTIKIISFNILFSRYPTIYSEIYAFGHAFFSSQFVVFHLSIELKHFNQCNPTCQVAIFLCIFFDIF
ncbi:hypothetical protein MXB_5671 [Myxobolus squamalis]|nr:hypothetical protein MXB_5671 [Myxobolus squamalis]